MTDQYAEPNWSPIGDDGPEQPDYQPPGNGNQPTESGTVSNAPGSSGGGGSSSGGESGKPEGSKKPASGAKGGQAANNGGKAADMQSELGDETVAQVPETPVVSADVEQSGGGGVSPLVWVLIAILVLGGISGFVALRARGASENA